VPREEEQAELFDELAGRETHARPRYYVPFTAALEDVRRRAGELGALEKRHPDAKPALERAVAESGMPRERLRWLPVAARLGFWTALIDVDTGKPVAYANVDPY